MSIVLAIIFSQLIIIIVIRSRLLKLSSSFLGIEYGNLLIPMKSVIDSGHKRILQINREQKIEQQVPKVVPLLKNGKVEGVKVAMEKEVLIVMVPKERVKKANVRAIEISS
ncbi:hypothetical protein ACLOJK_009185 [Asimina triloba]